jgi:hypothetical protein
MQRTSVTTSSGWLLAAGVALAALGLARTSPQNGNNQGGNQGGGNQGGTPPNTTQAVPITASGATVDSNNRMIAVTGIDVTGTSILYLVDTVNYRLAVYQANGGSGSTQGVKLVGARRIDLDLLLDGLNDKSDYSYKKLRQMFEEQGLLAPSATAGSAEVPPKEN